MKLMNRLSRCYYIQCETNNSTALHHHAASGPPLPPKEIGDLRKTLNTEVDSLRSEFMNLKVSLKQQLELTAGLAAQVRHALAYRCIACMIGSTGEERAC